MTSLRWFKIKTEALPRSSHSISLIGPKAYIFGGEIKPRQPVDNAVHVVDIKSGEYLRVVGMGEVPEPRVGHVAAASKDTVYIFGGRGGPDMNPLEEQGVVHAFNTATSTWTRLTPPSSSNYPAARSYHCATATAHGITIHAGCGDAATGRLNDLWVFNVSTRQWSQLPNAPGDGRGGAAICYSEGKIWRFGGFNGKTELGGAIDYLPLPRSSGSNIYDVDAGWQTVSFGEPTGLSRDDSGALAGVEGEKMGPGARSVHSLLPFGNKIITFFGEGKPSPTGGHDAAGNFWGDVWLFDPQTDAWEEVTIEGEGPGERGWFDADGDGDRVVVWGGIDSRNERLDDGWMLERV